MQPGYGVVLSIAPVRLVEEERSAAVGGSASAPRVHPAYRVTVRMADGSVQYRDIDRPEVRPREHVLLTNAGDVVPDAGGGEPPAHGAIQGGSLAPGETGGTPSHDPTQDDASGSAAAGGSARHAERCYQLERTLREQCLADEALKRKGAAPRAPTSEGRAPSRE